MVDRLRVRSSLHTAVVWDVLRQRLLDLQATGSAAGDGAQSPVDGAAGGGTPPGLDVLDVGGGTGGFAVPLARLGHRVTVVDPSPDALAALERRVAEAQVGDRVRAVQGDAAGLLDVVAAGSVDVALCHGVLEHVEDPAVALGALARCLRPAGALSVLAANRTAAVLARALAGHFADALAAHTDPAGRWGTTDPVPRRFSADELVALVVGAGCTVDAVHAVRVFSDLVPGALVDAEPGALDALLELEAAVAGAPAFRTVATQVHVLASAHG